MSRRVTITLVFDVADDVTDDDIASISGDAAVQVEEAIVREDETGGWGERRVDTRVLTHATIIETVPTERTAP